LGAPPLACIWSNLETVLLYKFEGKPALQGQRSAP
jgi:hypothetical protein